MMKLVGFAAVLAAGYAAFHFLFGHGWLQTSACIFIWILLASLYKPQSKPRADRIAIPGMPYDPWTDEEKQILFGDKNRGPKLFDDEPPKD